MSDFPIILDSTGAQPLPPSTLRAQLVALATGYSPGLTANLPGSLIEDLASTGTAGQVMANQAFVDLVNSISAYGANEPLLLALGNQMGVPKDVATNTSVNVVFSGPPGFVIGKGFTVSDGAHQYVLQDGAIIGSGGVTDTLYAVSPVAGSWAVPAGSVTQLVTSVPSTVVPPVTVTNPNTGTPGNSSESWAEYRARVIMANLAASQGMATYLKTLLAMVPGVQSRLIAVKQSLSPAGWEIIVGGGDPYQVAYAIYTALFDITSLVGSATPARNVTVSVNDFPDTYTLTFVTPPLQTVTMTVTWNTTSTNLVSNAAIAQLASPALVSYLNSIQASQPINLFMLYRTFQTAVESVLPEALLTTLQFSVAIDGVTTPPIAGTGIIEGDPESYFYTNPQGAGIVIARG